MPSQATFVRMKSCIFLMPSCTHSRLYIAPGLAFALGDHHDATTQEQLTQSLHRFLRDDVGAGDVRCVHDRDG
jgi:hypothetical protein